MSNKYLDKKDYDYIERQLSELEKNFLNESKTDYHVLKSLDDVFLGFEKIIMAHPYYAKDKNKEPISEYLSNEFGKHLSKAINNEDSYKIEEISKNISKIFAPKGNGFFKRKKEEYALNSAFNSLVKQYKLCKSNL